MSDAALVRHRPIIAASHHNCPMLRSMPKCSPLKSSLF